ncbi:uncharacterized protein B0J16DRAFT_418099 [Fusarium flagelliforme]|uniref:Uncharacterized protein n=1 Tax=Fusarium flagelliforme TaxID=2675880 RepID=A0A395MLT2_9HYPO|nr:uncharacterized protein B0J16DRAFT_418099 [Fusarium flagelliforme]KAH7174630.1 hypothetical protein B0J16DRAFT_418099 [Fusarium flagelliforme]RFN48333.1 hypothetical protein FIE12Z_7382 [Fusarium flagelliforme]
MAESQSPDCEYYQRQQRTKRQPKKRKQKTKVSLEEKSRIAEEVRVTQQSQLAKDIDLMNRKTCFEPVKEAAAKAAASTERHPQTKSLNKQRFTLYSPDCAKYGPNERLSTTDIEFYNPYALLEDLSAPVAAHISSGFIQFPICKLDYFPQPGYFCAGFRELKGIDTSPKPNTKADIQFIDDNHLMLKISRDLVWCREMDPFPYFRDEQEMPENAPQIYTYYGIRAEYAKEMAAIERANQQEEARAEKKQRKRERKKAKREERDRLVREKWERWEKFSQKHGPDASRLWDLVQRGKIQEWEL